LYTNAKLTTSQIIIQLSLIISFIILQLIEIEMRLINYQVLFTLPALSVTANKVFQAT